MGSESFQVADDFTLAETERWAMDAENPKPRGFKDTPIMFESEEALGLADYAAALVQFVQGCDTPMTIALQGDWGSGKTSMMNLIREGACKGRTRGIWFNTWQYSQFNLGDSLALSMMAHFAREVAANAKDGVKQTATKIAGTLGRFMLGAAGALVTSTTGMDAKAGLEAASVRPPDQAAALSALKSQLHALVAQNTDVDRFVVFIDDLDRLVPVKAVDLLESLKLFLDIDKCVYVLALDYQVVVQGLKEKFGDGAAVHKGKSFFDKIIQVPFNMPLNQYTVAPYFERLLQSLNVEVRDGDIEHYIDLVNHSVGFNPRSMKRLFNSLLLLQIVSGKKGVFEGATAADPAEASRILFAILCMQHSFPEVYQHLSSGEAPICDNLFRKLMDEKVLEGSDEFSNLRQAIAIEDRDRYFPRLANFMDAFFNALQLRSDTSDAGRRVLSADEAANLTSILSLSRVVGTESAPAARARRQTEESFLAALPADDKAFFEPVLAYLRDRSILYSMGTTGFAIKGPNGTIAECFPSTARKRCSIKERGLSPGLFAQAVHFLKDKGAEGGAFRANTVPATAFCELLAKLLTAAGTV